MSPDRHADRLYARLAGGAELTSDERRHVATCADCQRAVADVARLDEQLRAASASLASEPIPDADLEPLDSPRFGWAAPLAPATAAVLIAVAVGFGISQLRPPTGADATPTAAPSIVGERTDAPSPSPSTSPVPEATPPPAPLLSGGETCADGEAGFSIVVPDGWYANLRQGDLMACAFLAQVPFDPLSARTDPNFNPSIRLTTSEDPTPPGRVIEHGYGDSTFDSWRVERDGEEWLVSVGPLQWPGGPLQWPAGDPPWPYLHLATRADDQVGVEALTAIHGHITIMDPLAVGDEAVAEVDELFADADVCSDLERGVNVIYPDPWWTNTVLGDLQACSYFAPDSFDVSGEGSVPDGVAITLEVVTGNVGTIEEIRGIETLAVDQHAATRWELTPDLDTRTYQYVVELGDPPSDGPSLVVTVQSERADDYERDKAVLDEMMRRLIISPTPALIHDLERLPFCRSELVERTVEGDRHDALARACFWADYEAGEPAELITTGPTVEGAIIRHIYRLIGPGEIESIIDSTHDPLSSGGWHFMRCTALERQADDELTGAIMFWPTGCDDPIVVEP